MFDVCFLTFSKFIWAVTVSKKEKREDAVGLTVSLWIMQRVGRQWQRETWRAGED